MPFYTCSDGLPGLAVRIATTLGEYEGSSFFFFFLAVIKVQALGTASNRYYA
jgi:hypothetical protein